MSAARYIWPTSRGWVVGVGSVLGLLISLVHQTLFSFILTSTGLAVLAVSFLAALLALRGLRVRRAPSDDAMVGQIVSVPLEIANLKSRRRQDLVVVEALGCTPERETVSVVRPLEPRETIILARRVPAVHRGEFLLDGVLLRSGDPAGLFYRERRCRLPATLTIYPSYVSLQDLFIQQVETAATTTGQPLGVAGNSQDFFGVREYNRSDGLRHIHWRSSARYGRLMVKDFERNALSSVAILLDAQQQFVSDGLVSNLEYLVQAAASIVQYCSGMYCSLSLAAGGRTALVLPPEISALARPEIMYHLAALRPGTVPLPEVAAELLPRLPRSSVVFCLSLSGSPVLQRLLEDRALEGMEVRWCYAGRKEFTIDGPPSRRPTRTASRPEPRRGILRPVQLTPEMNLEHALNLMHNADSGIVLR